MADERATDILNQLAPRVPCGGSLTERVGRRGWERPRVSVSPRLYRQYRLADPWDPSAPTSDADVGLGPVGLRLGKKRQVAPHLTPKPPKAKAKSIAEKAREAALAAPRSPKVPPKPSKEPAPPKEAEKAPAAQTDDERIAAVYEARRKAEEQTRPRRLASRSPDTGGNGGPALRGSLPVRPDIDEITDEVPIPEKVAAEVPRQKSNGGRFRMQARRIVDAPVVKSLAAPEAPELVKPVRSAIPDRRAPPVATGGGMDDLFAAAAQQGRMSIDKKPEAPEEE